MRGAILAAALLLPAAAAGQGAQPILRLDLEPDSAVPGQPIELRVTVLAPTWLPSPPVFPSFEVPNVIVRLPEGASAPARERVDGATWSGVSRAYRLYPMTAGRFQLPPQTITATYADPATREPVTVDLRTPEFSFTGLVPEAAQELDPFIAAEAVTIGQSPEASGSGMLEVGGAVTREITARIDGASPLFLPPLIPTTPSPGFAAYPSEPVVTETASEARPAGTRSERVTYVAEAPGYFEVPPVRLEWLNLTTGRIETAEAPGFTITAVGAAQPTAAPPAAWQDPLRLAAILAGLALFGYALARLHPWLAAWAARRRRAWEASEAFAYAQAIAVLRARDVARSLRAIALWSERLPAVPGAAEASLAEALAQLGAGRYGPAPGEPEPAAWLRALAALSAARSGRRTTHGAWQQVLPPLNPALVQAKASPPRAKKAIGNT